MELFETNKYYVIVNGTVALFCDRLSGHISIGESEELTYEWNPVCLGQINGIIGKINFLPDGDPKLMLISKVESIGSLPIIGHVYRVTKVSIIPLNVQTISNLDIDLCKRHHFGLTKTEKIVTPPDTQKPMFKAFQEHMKSAAESVKPKRKDIRDKEKFERRMLEEFEKMFHDGANSSDSFYICYNPELSCDITSNIQRQRSDKYSITTPLWRRADDRFFWNKSMLQEAIDSADRLLLQRFGKHLFHANNELSESDVAKAHTIIKDLEDMLMPIIQGFVQVEPFSLHVPTHSPIKANIPNLPQIHLKHEYKLNVAIISRRNRNRAGTRFRRRGVDPDGNVANYVETEQILQVENETSPHIVSFVQVRGSVPIFWSQFSLKYRPPIILEKSEEENQAAFQKHFAKEFEVYEKVIVVNLVDTGTERSERKISDAYLHHLIKLNSPMMTCVLFDFHDYCRGLQFDNVSILMKGVTEIFRTMKYTWVDRNGMICQQKSIFRVNCIDCLDRTNVVQCMLAGVVIETQLRKLGLLSPDESLPTNFYQIMQLMWANNGDAISRQYSGTAAMKGDFTRTGARTMNGLMKDGVSSVNRYYLRLREMSRQAALDLMTGNCNSAEIISLRDGHNDTEQKLLKRKEENIKELSTQCKKACLKMGEECLTESILIHCDENEKEFHDMNTVTLITSQMLYFVRIDFLQKRQPLAIALPLLWINKIEIGYEPMLFRSNQPMIRIFYDPPRSSPNKTQKSRSRTKIPRAKSNSSLDESLPSGHYLAFKQPSLRLFNNILLEVKNSQDSVETLKAVAESFYLAAKASNPTVIFDERMIRFEKVKSEPLPTIMTFPVNINDVYENIILSSSFAALNYEYEDMMNLAEDVQDGLEPNEVVYGDSQSKEKEGITPIDMIKRGISKVKDKVKLRNWRDRLSNLSTKPTTVVTSPQHTHTDSSLTIDSSSIVQKGTSDGKWSTSHSSFSNGGRQFISASCDRLDNISANENARRWNDHVGSYNLKKVKSDFVHYSHRDARFDVADHFDWSNDEDNCPEHSSKNNDSGELTDPIKLKYSSFDDIDTLGRGGPPMTDDDDDDVVTLRSCGIIASSSIRLKLDQSSPDSINMNAQLAAVIGGVYQRRAERISRQLSVDEGGHGERAWTTAESSLSQWPPPPPSQILEHTIDTIEEYGHDFTDISSVAATRHGRDVIGCIQLPPVDISQSKVATQRLINKQLQLALFVEGLRREILGREHSLLTTMIIF